MAADTLMLVHLFPKKTVIDSLYESTGNSLLSLRRTKQALEDVLVHHITRRSSLKGAEILQGQKDRKRDKIIFSID